MTTSRPIRKKQNGKGKPATKGGGQQPQPQSQLRRITQSIWKLNWRLTIMLVFVDESGDCGMKKKKGSSDLFVVAAVIFFENTDANACDFAIEEIKTECLRRPAGEFKFNKYCHDYRIKFFQKVVNLDFMYVAFKDWTCRGFDLRYFTTWRLLVTEKAPDTPFARILAMFLSASLSTTPSRVTFPFFTMMRIGFCTPKAYFCKAG